MEKMIRGLEWFRTVDPNISVNAILAFLYALDQDKYPTQKDIEQKLDVSNAAASRNISYWLRFKKGKVAGQDFLTQAPDVMDRRSMVLTPTQKGRLFVKQLEHILEEVHVKEERDEMAR